MNAHIGGYLLRYLGYIVLNLAAGGIAMMFFASNCFKAVDNTSNFPSLESLPPRPTFASLSRPQQTRIDITVRTVPSSLSDTKAANTM